MKTFIARQPIFDIDQKVFGYELLFRSGLENVFDHPNVSQASSKVITDSFLLLGIDTICGGKKSFINITQDLLLDDYAFLMPPDHTIIEILESTEPNDEVYNAIKRLKDAGYSIALDDFVNTPDWARMAELADIIKVDYLATAETERRAVVQRLKPQGIKFVAEKVETRDAFQEAKNFGYDYFQGYFFSKPVILARNTLPEFKLHYFQILQELNAPDLDIQKIEQIVKREMSLSYKLLRYINSAFFGLRREITSIGQALTLLGEKQVRKWLSLLALASMGADKPEELVVQAIIRAKFCESLGSIIPGMEQRGEELFLMGMFTLMDAIVDQPMEEILKQVPVGDEIKNALLGKENQLRKVYNYLIAYEAGNWEVLGDLARQLSLPEAQVPEHYLQAVDWGQASFQAA